ncbi:putative uncharacterized domain protein [Bifidobacterium longum subsp. longum CECT 7347]|nr:putative uncharacterized domain protein [Bifidobacterium longum subsp. longum CECT 7347]
MDSSGNASDKETIMTVELITGFAGTPHIGSDDVGAFNAGLVGPGDYALATGNQLKATMSNANTIAVQSGDAVLNGRHVHLTGTTTATVQSGTQGQKRNDLAVLRYTKNTTTGVETCSLVVLKGTPTTGTPADPAHNTGSILDGVATADMPLYRIPLDGITVGTLVPLFNVLKPMKDVWDSLTQRVKTAWRVPYSSDNVLLARMGSLCIMTGNVKFNQSGGNNYSKASETLPAGYRPTQVNTMIGRFTYDGGQFNLLSQPSGEVTMLGNPGSAYACTSAAWFTNDPMPA